MGNYHPITQTAVIIGSKAGTTRTSIEMESTYQAESATEATKTFEVSGFTKLNLDVLYTMGASETSNFILVKLEGSVDGTNFYRIANDATTGSSSVLTAREFKFVGTDGAAATISIILDIGYKLIRCSILETGVASNKGSVFVEATITGR